MSLRENSDYTQVPINDGDSENVGKLSLSSEKELANRNRAQVAPINEKPRSEENGRIETPRRTSRTTPTGEPVGNSIDLQRIKKGIKLLRTLEKRAIEANSLTNQDQDSDQDVDLSSDPDESEGYESETSIENLEAIQKMLQEVFEGKEVDIKNDIDENGDTEEDDRDVTRADIVEMYQAFDQLPLGSDKIAILQEWLHLRRSHIVAEHSTGGGFGIDPHVSDEPINTQEFRDRILEERRQFLEKDRKPELVSLLERFEREGNWSHKQKKNELGLWYKTFKNRFSFVSKKNQDRFQHLAQENPERLLEWHDGVIRELDSLSDQQKDKYEMIWKWLSGYLQRAAHSDEWRGLVGDICVATELDQKIRATKQFLMRLKKDNRVDIVETLGGGHIVSVAAFHHPSDHHYVLAEERRVLLLSTNSEKRELLVKYSESAISSLYLSKDDRKVVIGKMDGSISVLNPWLKCEEFTLNGHDEEVTSIAVTADGKRIVSGSRDNSVKVWNMERKCEEVTLNGHDGWVTSIAVTADGKRIISGSYDKSVKVWNMERKCEEFK